MHDDPHVSGALLTDALRRAFRRARYCFEVPEGELLLGVDTASESLQRLLLACDKSCAAAITAYNPGGQHQDEARNQLAQQQLEAELKSLGLICFPGRHVDPAGHWPVEVSTLALGLSCAAACVIAARYGQLAILWSDGSGTPRLIEIASQQVSTR